MGYELNSSSPSGGHIALLAEMACCSLKWGGRIVYSVGKMCQMRLLRENLGIYSLGTDSIFERHVNVIKMLLRVYKLL